MSALELSAPGKLFLSGEYAVLWGGVARVVAVGPRTRAWVRRREDGRVRVCLAEGWLGGWATSQGVQWEREVSAGSSLVARTLEEALRRGQGCAGAGLDLVIAPSAVGPGGHKLGLGGSACAAVLTAESVRLALEVRLDALEVALAAHASAQGGKGSGGDVATCYLGGVVRFQRSALAERMQSPGTGGCRAPFGASPAVTVRRLSPPRVALAYAFTGQSASTRALIAGVEARLVGEAARRSFVERSDALGQQVEAGLGGGCFQSLAEAVRAQHALLLELGPLETEPMRHVLEVASAQGCAAKLSGAGGGDGCILLAPDEGTRAALLQGLRAQGFHALALEVEPGVRARRLAPGQASPPPG